MDAFKSWLFDSLDYLQFFFPPLEWMIEMAPSSFSAGEEGCVLKLKSSALTLWESIFPQNSIMLYLSAVGLFVCLFLMK